LELYSPETLPIGEYMQITEKQLDALRDFFGDYEIDEDWMIRHTDIRFEDISKTVTITIDNMNEQEYGWINV